MLLPLLIITFRGCQLEEFHRNRFIQAISAASLLAGMDTNPPQYPRERNPFPDYGQRLGKPALPAKSNIAGDVNMGGAGIAARIGKLFAVNIRPPLGILVNQCPGRANFNTGTAVLTP